MVFVPAKCYPVQGEHSISPSLRHLSTLGIYSRPRANYTTHDPLSFAIGQTLLRKQRNRFFFLLKTFNSIFSFVFKKLEWLSATPLATLRLLQFLANYRRASVTRWLHAARLSLLKLIQSDLHVGRKMCVVLLLTMDGYHGYATGNAISIAGCASV